MTIGEKIKKRRQELDLTLEEVGNAVGVGKSTVRKWETGMIQNMRRDKIELLAKVLNMDPVEFVTGNEESQEDQDSRPIWNEDIYAFLRAALQDDRYELVVHALEVPEDDIQYADRFLGSLNKKEG